MYAIFMPISVNNCNLVLLLAHEHWIILVCNCRWVEFKDKRVAKRVANMLNGEKIGMLW